MDSVISKIIVGVFMGALSVGLGITATTGKEVYDTVNTIRQEQAARYQLDDERYRLLKESTKNSIDEMQHDIRFVGAEVSDIKTTIINRLLANRAGVPAGG